MKIKWWHIILVAILLNVIYLALAPTDSTDKSKWNRSDLKVYTDHATGVQYIKAGWWGNTLTPRLGADGKPYIENNK